MPSMYFETMKQGKSSVLAHVIDRHDVGVVEPGDRAGLSQIGASMGQAVARGTLIATGRLNCSSWAR